MDKKVVPEQTPKFMQPVTHFILGLMQNCTQLIHIHCMMELRIFALTKEMIEIHMVKNIIPTITIIPMKKMI